MFSFVVHAEGRFQAFSSRALELLLVTVKLMPLEVAMHLILEPL